MDPTEAACQGLSPNYQIVPRFPPAARPPPSLSLLGIVSLAQPEGRDSPSLQDSGTLLEPLLCSIRAWVNF